MVAIDNKFAQFIKWRHSKLMTFDVWNENDTRDIEWKFQLCCRCTLAWMVLIFLRNRWRWKEKTLTIENRWMNEWVEEENELSADHRRRTTTERHITCFGSAITEWDTNLSVKSIRLNEKFLSFGQCIIASIEWMAFEEKESFGWTQDSTWNSLRLMYF